MDPWLFCGSLDWKRVPPSNWPQNPPVAGKNDRHWRENHQMPSCCAAIPVQGSLQSCFQLLITSLPPKVQTERVCFDCRFAKAKDSISQHGSFVILSFILHTYSRVSVSAKGVLIKLMLFFPHLLFVFTKYIFRLVKSMCYFCDQKYYFLMN